MIGIGSPPTVAPSPLAWSDMWSIAHEDVSVAHAVAPLPSAARAAFELCLAQ